MEIKLPEPHEVDADLLAEVERLKANPKAIEDNWYAIRRGSCVPFDEGTHHAAVSDDTAVEHDFGPQSFTIEP